MERHSEKLLEAETTPVRFVAEVCRRAAGEQVGDGNLRGRTFRSVPVRARVPLPGGGLYRNAPAQRPPLSRPVSGTTVDPAEKCLRHSRRKLEWARRTNGTRQSPLSPPTPTVPQTHRATDGDFLFVLFALGVSGVRVSHNSRCSLQLHWARQNIVLLNFISFLLCKLYFQVPCPGYDVQV